MAFLDDLLGGWSLMDNIVSHATGVLIHDRLVIVNIFWGSPICLDNFHIKNLLLLGKEVFESRFNKAIFLHMLPNFFFIHLKKALFFYYRQIHWAEQLLHWVNQGLVDKWGLTWELLGWDKCFVVWKLSILCWNWMIFLANIVQLLIMTSFVRRKIIQRLLLENERRLLRRRSCVKTVVHKTDIFGLICLTSVNSVLYMILQSLSLLVEAVAKGLRLLYSALSSGWLIGSLFFIIVSCFFIVDC